MDAEFQNVLGHDNFVWWIGVIEDRFDDGLAGGMRYKVRMFNSHTPDLNKIPTQNLPWTVPLYPPNNTKMASAAMEGDWAFGFYQDGMSKQAPVMIGVFPRYVQVDPKSEHGGFTANAKVESPKAEKVSANSIPVIPSDTPAMNPRRVGSATTPSVSYTYSGTVTEKADNNRAHVCDITNEIRLSAAIDFIKNLGLFSAARAAIESLTDGAAASPIATQIASAIKELRAIVKMIQIALNIVNKFVNDILRIVAWIRAQIAWILSLPARLLAMLQQCLTELYSTLANAVGYTISQTAGSNVISEVKGLYGDVLNTLDTAVQTQASAQAATSSTTKLLDPKSYGRP